MNLGFGWDRTENVLWRLTHGEFEGVSPKVVVVMIGTNNMDLNTVDEIAAGITAICDELHRRSPASRILLLGIFPRGRMPDATRAKVSAVNQRIAALDGKNNVVYLDLERDIPSGRRIDLRRRDVRLPAPDREGICHVGRGPVADADAPAVAVTDDRHGCADRRVTASRIRRVTDFRRIRQVTDGTDGYAILTIGEGRAARKRGWHVCEDRRATHGDSCNAGRHITSCSQQDVRVSQCPIRSVESVTADP